MIRILQVFGKLNLGGAESRVMDIYRNLDRERVQFDFVIHTQEKCFFEDEIEAMGGRIFRVPAFRIINMMQYKKAWRDFFKAHMTEDQKSEFRMVHGHMTSSAAVYLPIAKEYGVYKTIAHVRSAGTDGGIKGILTRFMRRNLADRADELFTCSKIAAVAAYGQKHVDEKGVRFVPNAIETSKFEFNDTIREEIRNEFGLTDRFVIGHVGRFHYAKNHEFLLKIFRDLCEDWTPIEGFKTPALILLGEGERMAEMKALTMELGISQLVLFLGNHKDVERYYQAMDFFLYPSRYEGLPGTVVEAQAAGLPVLMSDTICDEVMITPLVKRLPITVASDIWSGEIMDYVKATYVEAGTGQELTKLRNRYAHEVAEAGFDVRKQAMEMMKFYEG